MAATAPGTEEMKKCTAIRKRISSLQAETLNAPPLARETKNYQPRIGLPGPDATNAFIEGKPANNGQKGEKDELIKINDAGCNVCRHHVQFANGG
jgi:hypothetical protein